MPQHLFKAGSSRRRSYRIQSKFGSARQWRSRKARPCDTCRKRKSACVIEDQPPCLFCRRRGLSCQSSGETQRKRPICSQEADDPGTEEHVEPSVVLRPHEEDESTNLPSQPLPTGNAPLSSPDVQADGINLQSHLASPCTTPMSRCAEPQSSSIIQTLEDIPGRTAHPIGLSAEQDTHLLAAFRSAIIDERNRMSGDTIQVSAGNVAAGTPPIHFNLLWDQFQPYDNHIRHESCHTIESKVAPYGPDLVRLYFKHVHPVFCVVSKVRFLRAYKEDKLSLPASLRGAVYGLGSVYWNQDPRLKTIHRPFEQYELFHSAQASLERELDAPNLWKMQACLLMLHEKPGANYTYETPRVWTLSAQAVACAQIIGLHRDPSDWSILPWEKSLRKKLWWATYLTDIWSSVAHGNPPHIYRASYTTPELYMDDLKFDEDVPEELRDMVDPESAIYDVSTAARFIESVALANILHNLLETAFLDTSYRDARADFPGQEAKVLKIKEELESWHSMIPQCVTMNYATNKFVFRNNAPLYLAYFATQILLSRALMTPASRDAKANPGSSLRRFFDTALEQVDAFLEFMNDIMIEGLQAFWGRHARSQLILVGNFLVYLFLLSSSPEQVRATFRQLERFHDSLQGKCALLDEGSVHLIRPVALRIDSFFTQTAQIMRRGLSAGAYTPP